MSTKNKKIQPVDSLRQKLKLDDLGQSSNSADNQLIEGNIRRYFETTGAREDIAGRHLSVCFHKRSTGLKAVLLAKGHVLREIPHKELVDFFVHPAIAGLFGIEKKVVAKINGYLEDYAGSVAVPVIDLRVVIGPGTDGIAARALLGNGNHQGIPIEKLIQYFTKP